MKTDIIISEIENYLSKTDVSYEETNDELICVTQYINDVINRKGYQKNNISIHGAMINNKKNADNYLFMELLENCSLETLDSLEITFGPESEITKIIKEIRSKKNNDCKAGNIEDRIEEMLIESKNNDNILYQLLCKHLELKGYKSDSDFYNSISMPRQVFARIRDAKKTLSKQNILQMIIGLKLDYTEATEFLNAAGYSFRKNDKRDTILMFIIKNIDYDLDMVNEILYKFGVKTLISINQYNL